VNKFGGFRGGMIRFYPQLSTEAGRGLMAAMENGGGAWITPKLIPSLSPLQSPATKNDKGLIPFSTGSTPDYYSF